MKGAEAARQWWLDHPEEAARAGLPPDGNLLQIAAVDFDGLRTCDQCCSVLCACPCHRKDQP